MNTTAPEPNLPITAGCDLYSQVPGAVTSGDSGSTVLRNVDGSDQHTIPLNQSFTLPAAGSVVFRCGASDNQLGTPVGTVAANVHLVAIKVGSIH